jgi:hypothetical protein
VSPFILRGEHFTSFTRSILASTLSYKRKSLFPVTTNSYTFFAFITFQWDKIITAKEKNKGNTRKGFRSNDEEKEKWNKEKDIKGCIPKFPDLPPGARIADVQVSATRYSCFTILWVSLVSFSAITLCVASQRVFIIDVYFVINSVRKLYDTPSYVITFGDFTVSLLYIISDSGASTDGRRYAWNLWCEMRQRNSD